MTPSTSPIVRGAPASIGQGPDAPRDPWTTTIAVPDPANVSVSAEQVAAVGAQIISELQVALAVTRTHAAELRTACEALAQQVEALKLLYADEHRDGAPS
jgi:hypothetical protein